MAILARKGAIGRSDYIKEQSALKMPNPGDIFMIVAFGWAAVCFLMVVGGGRLARQLSVLSGSAVVRDVLQTEQSAIALLMVVGILGLAAAFYLISSYRTATIAVLIFAMTFANARWVPLYTVAFAAKYLILVYLGAFSALFFMKNGWRLVATDGYRLVCLYVGWIALVAVINGLRIGDLWYLGTEFCLMIGFGIAWLSTYDSTEKICELNRMFAYIAVPATVFSALAVLVVPEYIVMGRFTGMAGRATGFATIYAVFVVALFWMAMYEKDALRQKIFGFVAFIGYGMILWSGTRNATVATLVSVVALWWIFRSQILVYALGVGVIGLLIQLILGDNQDFSTVSNRLASTENTRLGAWELYFGLTLKSPIFGYGYDGLRSAVYGEFLVGLISDRARLNVPGVHNLYIGFGVRYGFVGLGLMLAIFYYAARSSWQVIFNRDVPDEDKRVIILPVALVLLILLEGLFEDTMGSTGRGTLHGIVFALAMPIVYLHSKRILAALEEQKVEARPSMISRSRKQKKPG